MQFILIFIYRNIRMDVLDHMLTDPLDSEKANDGRITEECMLGNCQVSLPEDLLEDVSS